MEMNRLAVYSYLTRFAKGHACNAGSDRLFIGSLPGKGWVRTRVLQLL